MTARADSSSGKPADQPAPSVSVVLPTRQRRELVRRAVASVFAQTFTAWELLVVDDGSTDGTRDALAAVRDPRLRYRWQPHRGVSAARNAALGRARGEIVAFLDSDDVWLPHHLAAVTELLRGHPEAVLATTCGRYALGAGRRGGLPRLLDPLPEHLYAHLAGYPSCVAVRRAPVMECGGFDERQLVGEDADLFLRLALRGPFVIARRRTSVKQHTPGLKDWGRRRGLYLDAAELMPRRAIEELRRLPGARSAELERDAEGALHFAAALRGLQARDERSVRIALAQACRALPGLSRRGELVLERLEILPGAHVPDERLAHLTLVATCWPDPRADAALMARWCALLAALRRARLTHAAQLIAGWPLRPTPGALRRARPALAQRAHRRLDAWRYRSRRRVDRAWRATGARPRASVARPTGRTSN